MGQFLGKQAIVAIKARQADSLSTISRLFASIVWVNKLTKLEVL